MNFQEQDKSQFFESVSVHVAPWVHVHEESIKTATKLKNGGDIAAAIEQCKVSIGSHEKVYGSGPSPAKFTNTLRDYFKLARYLGDARRFIEAQAVLGGRLRAAEDPQNALDFSTTPMDRSMVYGEMRKLAAKTGDYVLALKYAAAEMVAWNQGLVLQQRIQELPGTPIEVDDLPRYIRTYCSRLESRFTASDFAAFLNSAYEAAMGEWTRVNLQSLEDQLAISSIEPAQGDMDSDPGVADDC